jgi:fimbrial protein
LLYLSPSGIPGGIFLALHHYFFIEINMFRLIALIIFIQLLLIQPGISSDISTVGKVHFYGAVVNSSCSIDTQSFDQSVMMGQVRTGSFLGPGSWAEPVTFWIKLENCATSTSESASVTFNGLADLKDPQVFQAGFGSGAAKGVGIGIFDMRGNQVIPDSQPRKNAADCGRKHITVYRPISLCIDARYGGGCQCGRHFLGDLSVSKNG